MRREFATAAAPHHAASTSVRGVMALVLLALLPAVLVQTVWFGVAIWLQLALAIGFALALEAVLLKLRGVPVAPFLRDLSAPVTAVLFVLCIPPLTPWWVSLTAMVAAIVVAKQLYGGLGYNLFNPAMVGYVVALLCFPRALTEWPLPGYTLTMQDALRAILLGQPAFDAIAGATALDQQRNGLLQGLTLGEIGRTAAFQGEALLHRYALALAYLGGGLLLIWRRVIGWRIPLSLLASLALLSLPGWLYDPDHYASPLFHLSTGASLIGAFFIATDPVSGCTTPRGRLLFAFGVAAITLAIRQWGQYPDGLAFAILLMNAAAPWIDLHTRPRYYGEDAHGP